MKIAFITQPYPPMVSGASLVVKTLAEGMEKRGHKVLVIAASDRGDTYVELSGKLRVIRLKSELNPKRANQRYVAGSYKEIHAEIERFKPDLIHIHDLISLGVLGLISGKRMSIPVIATIHQLPWFISAYLPDYPGLKTSIENCLWGYSRWLSRQCQLMIVPTPTIVEQIKLKAGFETVAISNGVDLTRFRPNSECRNEIKELSNKYGISPNLPIILHVGRLDVDKNVDCVIRVAANVFSKISAQLLVVGDGECRNNLIELSHDLGVQQYCHFTGFVDPLTDLPALYRLAMVFITASEIETQGLVLLEAMSSGLPIVAVDATCIHEAVTHGINGYLSPPGDEEGLTDNLIEILSSPQKAIRMGEMSRFLVLGHSIENSLDQHEKLFQKIVFQFRSIEKSVSWRDRILQMIEI
jgi:glycosyltransferase involved in cell wall biosynthesis